MSAPAVAARAVILSLLTALLAAPASAQAAGEGDGVETVPGSPFGTAVDDDVGDDPAGEGEGDDDAGDDGAGDDGADDDGAGDDTDGDAADTPGDDAADASIDDVAGGDELWTPRSLEDRYVDALAGSWAGTGIFVGAVGVLGLLGGLAGGCAFQPEAGCIAGSAGGLIAGSGIGWIIGPGVGAASGAGLQPLEGLAVWALGLGTNLAVIGLSVVVGLAVDAPGGTWGLGKAWGLMAGVFFGAFAQVFLTPLYAVALFDERRATEAPTVSVMPFVAPTPEGAVAGVGGAF